MANVLKPRRSGVASAVPTTANLADGEMAVNTADKVIYVRDGAAVVPVANFGVTQPKIFVQSTDPGAAAAEGDLWIW